VTESTRTPEWLRYAPEELHRAGYPRLKDYEPLADDAPRTPIGRPADALDQEILNALQGGFPLVARPWDEVARAVGTDGRRLLDRVRRMRAGPEPVIRQISAIFDTRKLGHDSMLVAFRIPDERIVDAARALNRCPGISHNYERNGALNLWFTLAVPPAAELTLEETVARLARLVDAEHHAMLPTLRLFKIGVRLDVSDDADPTARDAVRTAAPRGGTKDEVLAVRAAGLPSAGEIALIRELQEDVELVERPFRAAADRLGIAEDAFLARALELVEKQTIRRVAAVLRHQVAGFVSNGMGVWIVPEERAEEVGLIMASFRAVTHCYKRPTYPRWPYSHFTMIHGRSRADVEAVARAISAATGIGEYDVLYSQREFKKTRVPYFFPGHLEWERELLAAT
jgi:siroheme decarboxylase